MYDNGPVRISRRHRYTPQQASTHRLVRLRSDGRAHAANTAASCLDMNGYLDTLDKTICSYGIEGNRKI